MRGLAVPTVAALSAGLAAVMGGSAAVAVRFVIAETDPAALSVLRFAIASVAIGIFVFPRRRIRIARADLPWVVLLALMQFAVYGWLFAASLAYISAGRSAIITSSIPVLTLLLAAALGRERLTLLKLAGVAAAFGGVALALSQGAGAEHPEAWRGDAYMVVASVVGAVYNAYAGTYLRRYGASNITALAMPIGTVALLLVVVIGGDYSGFTGISLGGWLVVLYLGSIAGAALFFLWTWALERTTPTRVAIMATINPISAIVLGALLLGEPVALEAVIGFGAVLLGIILTQWRGRGTV